MAESRGIKIFLGHASDDKTAVLSLYERLKDQGYDPWLDKKNLIAGQNWREEIPKAIKSSDIVIACLSKQSVTKQGYVQQELRLALTEYSQKPPGSIYLIPLKLEPCDVPDVQHAQVGVSLLDLHWLDYWEADGFSELLRAIEYGRESSSAPLSSSSLPAVFPPESPPEPAKGKFERFNFEVVTVDAKGQERDRRTESADHFLENLGDGVFLDMVRIPGGEFLMGSPDDEPGREDNEGPQHRVIVPEFFMGRYPVTQYQWRVVAGLEKVNLDLKVDPSYFNGSNRPVESVSWKDAVEFCDRISRLIGQQYHLPSEAQWEYACRAGSSTPFHFGLTLTSEISNYLAERNYGAGPIGEVRKQTTKVGDFPANAFGLYDMHGTVWEWCRDAWHGTYSGAPTDGSAWLDEHDDYHHVLRGGSWANYPCASRSACRYFDAPLNVYRFDYAFGFRASCASVMAL